MKLIRLALLGLIWCVVPQFAAAGNYYSSYNSGSYNYNRYNYGTAYYTPYSYGYYPSYGYNYYPGYGYNYKWWSAGVYDGRWFPAGYYAWVNGGWYRQNYGYEYGIVLPVAPLTTQVLTLPAGLPQATALRPAAAGATVVPVTTSGQSNQTKLAPQGGQPGGFTAQDVADLKAILGQLRQTQAKPPNQLQQTQPRGMPAPQR